MVEPTVLRGDPSTYMAAERTFLAWLRTGIALMGFGFVVARFGLFLHELVASKELVKISDAGFSLPVGILLIVLGMLVLVVAPIRHRNSIRAIDCGQFRQTFGTTFAFWLTGLLAAIGLAITVYLIVLF